MADIIAEFCQNHGGDFSRLQDMIHQAADAGATYAKIQTIFADDLAFREEFEEGRSENGKTLTIKRPYRAEYDRLKKLELTYEQQNFFFAECRKFGLKPLTTCFTRSSADKIAAMSSEVVKVASYDCGSLALIKDLAGKFNHIIISTGATFDDEIEKTTAFLNHEKVRFSLLHCVTIYPTPLSAINLNRMDYLRRYTSKVGLSEHTLYSRDGNKASLAAIYFGAQIIERHFTILPPSETRDGPVSIGPNDIKELVQFSRMSKADQKQFLEVNVPEYSIMLGHAERSLTDEELLNRAYYRGRFASHAGQRVIYNWEEGNLA